MVSNLSMETIAIKENNTQRIHKLYKTLDTICCYPSKGSREVVNIPAKQICNMEEYIFILLGGLEQSHLSFPNVPQHSSHYTTAQFKILLWFITATILNVTRPSMGHSDTSNFVSQFFHAFDSIRAL